MRRIIPIASLVLVACAIAKVGAQTAPSLSAYFSQLPSKVVDSSYNPKQISNIFGHADLDGDGKQDLVVLGMDFPSAGATTYSVQPGRLLLGDGNGGFTVAPTSQFPVDTLNTVHPRKLIFEDFNNDGRSDLFVSAHGWDAIPFPGEQNRLYLSQPGGGWRDATSELPAISDFSHSSAAGDLTGRGIIDLVVGNGYLSRDVSYTLVNSGSGQFSMTRSNLPIGADQTMDPATLHQFPGTILADLNDDGLPELIVTADASSTGKNRRSTILWNRSGSFVETDKTLLPAPGVFASSHIDLDAKVVDVNRDGLKDIVMVGAQGQPRYDGWFVQLLINKGGRQFVDETNERIPEGSRFGGAEGVAVSAPWAEWVNVIDFNHDGVSDFSLEFLLKAPGMLMDQPLVWLNDGTGHFSTLKAADFVTATNLFTLGGFHLVETRNGYSVITPQVYPGSGGLRIVGLVATKPYK